MSVSADVVVIGGGLAGRMAALSAADEGVSVAIVTSGESTLPMSTGLVDVLGYTPDGDGPLATPFEHLSTLPDHHPFSLLGESTIGAGLTRFDTAVGDVYSGAHTDANALVTTQMGTPKPTARYPDSFAPGLLSRDGDILLVGIDNLPGFDAEFAARELTRTGVPVRTRGATIDLLGDRVVEQPRLHIASALDADDVFPSTADRPIRARLAAQLDSVLEGESRVGLPAILGLEETADIRAELEAELGVEVFEIPTPPPSLPGRRLERRLSAAMERTSIEFLAANAVSGYEARDGTLTELSIEGRGRQIRGSQFVLATGGLIGGGLAGSRGDVREPIFDLPTRGFGTRDGPASDPLDPQPFGRTGLIVDDTLRPIEGEDAVFSNLFACGAVLGGFDPAIEHSGGGVAIATGYAAGRAAGRRVES